MRIYLIEGISGTGKTTVCEELKKRGYRAVEADEVIAHYADPKTGLPTDERTPDNWIWNEEKFINAVKQEDDSPVFICGGAMNQEDFKHHFDKVFTLHVDDETLKQRLMDRTNNDFGKKPDELALMLEWNQGAVSWSKQRGTILIDATKLVNEVVDEILKHLSIDKWNKNHSEIPPDKSVSNYAVLREKEFPRKSIVCDIGGGTGADAIYFLQQGHRVILVDISDFALSTAKNKAGKAGYDLETHRITLGNESIPLEDSSVDVIYSRLALHYFDARTTIEALKDIFIIMKKDGKAFITIKSPDDAKEMDFLKSTAVEKDTGVFEDNGDIKSRFSIEQIEKILTDAEIADFTVRPFVENLSGRVDKVKSGNKELLLNEIQFTK